MDTGMEVFEHYGLEYEKVKKVVEESTRSVNKADIEDVRQTALLKIFIALKKLASEGITLESPYGYIRRTVLQVKYTYFRYKKVRTRRIYSMRDFPSGDRPEDWQNHSTEVLPEAYSSYTDASYDLVDVRLTYEKEREGFTPSQRTVLDTFFTLSNADSMRISDISEIAGVHKSQGSRALQNLRKLCI